MFLDGSNNILFVTSFYSKVTAPPQLANNPDNPTTSISPNTESSSTGTATQGNTTSSSPNNTQQLKQLSFVRQSLLQLQSTLDALNTPFATTRSFRIGTPAIAGKGLSTSSLGLTTTPASPTTLTSTAEINTAATSFTPFGPDFNGFGISTATATIGGLYLGSQGTGTLTFRVDPAREGTHGVDDLRIKVYDPDDNHIEDININKEDPINQLYTLSNGLNLRLSAGDLVGLDDFTVDVVAGVPTSYGPTDPEWNGAVSSAEGTVGGIYDGSNGSGTLTFRVDRDGVHGVDDLRLKVYDPLDDFIENIDINKEDPLNQIYTLTNGLTFTLGAGDFLDADEFTIEVSASVGSAVNPDKAFDGTRNDNPNFDSGLSVTAGSFEVNGESISVLATDTINTVLAKINASAAGVTAGYSSANDEIQLIQNTPGATPTITVGNDTSGFLAATKLSAATPVAGVDEARDENQILSSLAAFSSVTSGNLLINAVSIAINVDSDSLNDILSRITDSAAGVTASLSGDKVSITSNTSTSSVVLDSNGTGLFGALNITDGTYESTVGTQQVITRKGATPGQARQIRAAVLRFTNAFNTVFNDAKLPGKAGSAILNLRKDLQNTLGGAFNQTSSKINTKTGLTFDFSTQSGNIFKAATVNSRDLLTSLEKNPDTVKQVLHSLSSRIATVLQNHQTALNTSSGSTGVFLNVVG